MQKRPKQWMKFSCFIILVVSGCAAIARYDLNQLYGQETPTQRAASVVTDAESSKALTHIYHDQIKPIIESRCIVCHACYDAPCQLKMTSIAGIERGANKEKVYNGKRLLAAEPNRLFMDAFSPAQWRKRDFYPVLNERQQAPKANTQASVLARMLLLKQQHPLPKAKLLDQRFDMSLNREQQCPKIEEFDDYAKKNPFAGMPYGLPALNKDEHDILINWLEQGAHMPAAPKLPIDELQAVNELEALINADDLKIQLSARYIFEHLFSSHLYFSALVGPKQQPQFYNLVRSKTPPGQPLEPIPGRRPFDDPGVERVYYRLQAVISTIVNKTHQPYAIDKSLLLKWRQWFITAKYQVKTLPSYDPQVAANPLTAFTQLPINSRYRFMLERAENTIMGYIKGPVCRGQVALNVINDRFWVYFIKPEVADSPELESFYLSQRDNLRLPAEQESTTLAISWVKYASRQGDYLRARNDFMNRTLKNSQYLSPDAIWDGDGDNPNASLTIFRHFDNATVVKGLIGTPPKTAWIIDYTLLERIHYLLVAGFDVYGNFGHQLMTRLYMDFLRLEGESNFLALLPPQNRREEYKAWYQKAGPELTKYIQGDIDSFKQASGIQFSTKDPKTELFQLLGQRVSKVQPQKTCTESCAKPCTKACTLSDNSNALLAQLGKIKGVSASIMPELTMIMVEPKSGDKPEIFTLVRNSAHYNVNSLFSEDDSRNPQQDDMTLVHGLLGSYPDAFWRVKENDVAKLVAEAQQIKTQNDYSKLLDHFAVRRTAPDFWAFSDRLNHAFQQHSPIEGGWLDYNRLENR